MKTGSVGESDQVYTVKVKELAGLVSGGLILLTRDEHGDYLSLVVYQ